MLNIFFTVVGALMLAGSGLVSATEAPVGIHTFHRNCSITCNNEKISNKDNDKLGCEVQQWRKGFYYACYFKSKAIVSSIKGTRNCDPTEFLTGGCTTNNPNKKKSNIPKWTLDTSFKSQWCTINCFNVLKPKIPHDVKKYCRKYKLKDKEDIFEYVCD